MPIDAVQGHQMRVVQPTDQPPQQGLLDIFARRSDRQKMRLVCHHQVFVGVQDRLHHRDRLLVGHFTKIVDAQAFAVRQVDLDGLALPVQYPAPSDPVQPLLATDGAEMLAQALQHRLPGTGWQIQRTGLMMSGGKR
ncbi:hypothetical protein D3C76_1206970 [compost metagenome]